MKQGTISRSGDRTAQSSEFKVPAPRLRPSVFAVRLALAGLASATALQLATPSALAAPQIEGTVRYGDVNIQQQNATTTNVNQGSQKAIMDLTVLRVPQNNTLNFNQPGKDAVFLGRAVGNTPFENYGTINANGQLFLVNPQGVYFAPGSSVNVGGLVASTNDIRNEDFLAGRYVFQGNGGTGTVVNAGKIEAPSGYAALIGRKVSNEGTIVARTVALAAGNRVALDMIGDRLISVRVEQAALGAAALNKGTILAEGGSVYLLARSADALLDTVVNNTGIIRANSLVERNGVIVLDGGSQGVVANSGTLDVSGKEPGATGGTVKVLGEYVGLFNGSRIDASGDAGGGTVLIGGNFHGFGPEQNAKETYVASDTVINADAINSGNGGHIAIWSDNGTEFYGAVSARGGAQSGDGGFVEISGKDSLVFAGNVDTSAPKGSGGNLLLDPADIFIIDGAATTGDLDATLAGSGNSTIVFADGNVGGNTVTVGQLQAQGNTNITLEATNTIRVGTADGTTAANVDLSASLTSNANTLTLSAGNGSGGLGNVTFNTGSVITTGGGAVAINAGQTGDTGGNAILGAITTNGGAITVNALNSVSLVAGQNASTGNVVITAQNGNITGAGVVTGNNVTLDSATGVGTSPADRVNTAAQVLAARSRVSGGVFLAQANAVSLATIGGVTNSAAGGGYNITSGGAITVNNGINTGGTGGATTLTTTAGGIAIGANDVGNGASATTLVSADTITGTTGVVHGTDVTLDSVNGVGTSPAARLNTAADNLAARASLGGGVFVAEADAVTLATIGGVENLAGAAAAAYDVTAGGTITVGTGGVNIAGTGTTRLETTAGNIAIGHDDVGNLAAATTLIAAGSITGPTGPGLLGVVQGTDVVLDSGTGVGTQAARVVTAANTLAARTRTSGSVFISEVNDVSLATIGGVTNSAAGGGGYNVTASGVITVDTGGVTTANGAIQLIGSSLTNNDTITNGGGASTANILLRADTFNLHGNVASTVEAGGGGVIITPNTPTRSLGIEAATQQTNITNADLATIHTTDFVVLGSANQGFTGSTIIGQDAKVDGGTKSLAFFRAAGPANSTTIGVNGVTTTGDVFLSGGPGNIISLGGTVEGNHVALTATTGIGTSTNRVQTHANVLAINNIANGAFVTEADGVSLATITRTVGGTPNNITNSGGNGGYNVIANGAISIDSNITTNNGAINGTINLTGDSITNHAAISNGGAASTANIILSADALSLAGGTINSNGGATFLRPRTPGNSFGIEDASAQTHVNNADIASISTTNFVGFGAGSGAPGAFTGKMTIGVDNPVNGGAKNLAFLRDPATVETTTIGANGVTTTGNVIISAGAGNIESLLGGTISGNQVELRAGTGIGDALNRVKTSASTLAVQNAGNAGSGAFVQETDTVTLADVNQTVGGTASNATNTGGTGAYDVKAGGTITLGSNVNTTGTGSTQLATTLGDIVIGTNSVGNLSAATTLVSAGAITGNTGVVRGTDVTLDSATGVGSALAPVNTAAHTLAARSRTSGDVFVSENDAVTLATIGGVENSAAAGAAYDVTAGGAIAVGTGGVNTAGTGSTTLLAATGGISIGDNNVGNLAAATSLTANGGGSITGATGSVRGTDVVLNAGGSVGTELASLNTAANTLTVAAGTGVFINEADAVSLTSVISSGPVVIANATGDMTVATILAAGQPVTLTANSGSIVDDANDGTGITGSAVSLNASGAVGAAGNQIDTAATSLSANAGLGGVFITQSGAVTLSSIISGGPVSISNSGGDMTVATVSAGLQGVTLTANAGSILDDGVNTTRITGGAVSLNAATGGIGASGNEIDTTATSLSANAGLGGVFITQSGAVTLSSITSGGPVNIANSTGDMTVVTVAAGTQDVTLTASAGSILDDGSNATRITGGAVSLNAPLGGVGAPGNEIDTAASSLAVNAGPGGAFITELDAVTLSSITSGGHVNVSNAAGDMAVAGPITTTGGGTVTLNANAGALNIGGAGDINSTGQVDLAGAAGINTAGDVTANGGHVAYHSAVTLTGNVSVSAGTGDILFTSTVNGGGANSLTTNNTGNWLVAGPISNMKNLTVAGGPTSVALPQTTLTGDLSVSSAGAVTNTGDLSVDGNARFSGSSVTIGAVNAFNAGTLTFNSTGAVSISEGSSMDIVGTNTAGSATLSSTGAISDASATSIAVTGLTDVSGTTISLGGGTFNTGTLRFNSAGHVSVAEDSGMDIVGANTAASATLSSTGALSDAGAASIAVAGLTDVSGASISLGGGVFTTSALRFNSAGTVSISAASPIEITGTNTANTLTLTSTGAITDAAGTHITVGDDASFTGTSIVLADNALDVLHVTDKASFSGGSITIAAPGDVNFGRVQFNAAGAVVINEDCCTVITGGNTANSLDLTSGGGISSDPAGTDITVSGNAKFSGTSISLGNAAGDHVNFGTLTFNSPGAVSITEKSGTAITGSNTAASLVLSSAGAITEVGTSLVVTGNARFSGTSIDLGNNVGDSVNFGSLTFNSAGAVSISEDSATVLSGASTAGSLTLKSLGSVTQQAGATLVVNGAGNINAGSNPITLTNAGNDFVGTLTLKGTVTNVTDTNGISVMLDTGETIVIANGNLTSTGDLSIGGTTSGNLIGISNGGVVEWTNLTVGSAGSPKAALLIAAKPSVTITGPGSTGNAFNPGVTFTKLANATGGTVNVPGGEFVLIADNLPRNPSSPDLPTITANTAVLQIMGLTPGNRVTLKLNGQLRLLADKGVFRFTGASSLPQGVTTLDPKKVQLFIGNVSITSTTDELAQRSAVTAAQQSALNSASADARQSFGTDSVTQQIDMGFAGDVGIAPTMAHNVPLQGEIISTPEGVTESKGGQ